MLKGFYQTAGGLQREGNDDGRSRAPEILFHGQDRLKPEP